MIGAASLLWWLSASLPRTTGNVSLPGLSSPVTIERDEYAIPHITAATGADAYFALGHVHAQDRLWQMEATRRLGAGRLSEIGGDRFLDIDRAMRVLGLYRRAEQAYESLAGDARAAVDSYVRGVNSWIESDQARLPPAYALAGISASPWTGPDSLVWGRLMAVSLSGNWRREALWSRLAQSLPPNRLDALVPRDHPTDPVTIPDLGTAAVPADERSARDSRPKTAKPVIETGSLDIDTFDALLAAFPAPPANSASNAWIVDAGKSGTGAPVLANDPHLRLQSPGLFYLVRINTPGFTIAGATVPGVPFHIIGHNGRIAWGMTTTGADTEDLVLEAVDPTDPGRYLAPDGPREFSVRQEVIKVRNGPSVSLTVRETRNGPVISDVNDRARSLAGPGRAVALRSTGLSANDGALAFYRINRARDWREFRRALARHEAPVQNFFYADTAGGIGVQVAGIIPVRRQGDGTIPVPGTDPAFEWTGTVPFDLMPRSHNPPGGRIINANNRINTAPFPLLATEWEAPYRAARIEEILNAGGAHGPDAAAVLQADAVSVAARRLTPRLLAMTERSAENGAALSKLAAWDHAMDKDRPEPLIYQAWVDRIFAALMGPALLPDGPVLGPRQHGHDPRLLFHIFDNDPGWCALSRDDADTAPAANPCAYVVARALENALRKLAINQGPDPAQWRWGKAHRAQLDNSTLGWIPAMGWLVNIRTPTDGDNFTVNRGTFRTNPATADFPHVHGAVLRVVYDLGDLDQSRFIQPTGQSGHPLSRHYSDLNELWRQGRSVFMPARLAAPSSTLTLAPVTQQLPRR